MRKCTLAIDIGIKNLSFCIMNCEDKTDLSSYKIELWETYNTLEEHQMCEKLTKTGKVCGKKCSLKYTEVSEVSEVTEVTGVVDEICNAPDTVYTCKTHFPKELLPVKRTNTYKPKLVKNYLLQDIAKIMINKVSKIYSENQELFQTIDTIHIELQPKINPSMKTMSHIIYGKFIDFQIEGKIKEKCIIRFIAAKTKLRAYTGPPIVCHLKNKYSQRKWLSAKYVQWILENKFCKDQKELWLDNFLKCKKLDDMSDTCLYCINSLFGIPPSPRKSKKRRL